MNQLDFATITCNRCQARENACTIGFGFPSHWLKNGAIFANQSKNVVKQNQSKRELNRYSIENGSNILIKLLLNRTVLIIGKTQLLYLSLSELIIMRLYSGWQALFLIL